MESQISYFAFSSLETNGSTDFLLRLGAGPPDPVSRLNSGLILGVNVTLKACIFIIE